MFRSQMSPIVYTAFLVLLSSSTGFGEDSNDDEPDSRNAYAKEEYDHIFKSIPILFEQLFTVLKDRPQVLEQGDAQAFNDIYNTINNKKSKKSIDFKEPSTKSLLNGENLRSDAIDVHVVPNGLKALAANEDDGKTSENDESTLDPADVAEKAILVEEKLEEHNED